MNYSETDRRGNPRLSLTYPIEVQVQEPGRFGGTRGVTANLSARGAYFKTFEWEPFSAGRSVRVTIQVPHPFLSGDEVVQLTMTVAGRVRRLDRIVGREALGEDALDLKGVALVFDTPLEFDYYWA
ncbi:MAG: PilZ domain-containing protein [Planctomycetota bacterium]|jgi:hypothetical protein